jgi:hypothetical protein
MGYYQDWNAQLADDSDPKAASAFMERYYSLETEAYDRILKAHPEVFAGTASELADKLGFGTDMVIFAGFMDASGPARPFRPTSTTPGQVDIRLESDFEKNSFGTCTKQSRMAGRLESWAGVLDPERHRSRKGKPRSHIAERQQTRRNDPCPAAAGRSTRPAAARS